jgi:peptidoglycan/xylan/chitin deacetylase (PgdA/CDA1 family)
MLTALLAAVATLPTPAHLPTVPRLTQYAEPVYCAGARGHDFALTFDDGPSPYTLQLVRVLRRRHAHATFFFVGSRVALWPDGVRAAARNGEIGNHTWSHAHLPALSGEDVRRELAETQRVVARAVGAVPRVFRPPYEESTPAIELTARSLRLLDVRWSVDTGDSYPGTPPSAVVRAAIAALAPGAILLLHDPHPTTPRVAAAILRAARRRRLRAVTVSELLAREPPSVHQLGSTGSGRCPH